MRIFRGPDGTDWGVDVTSPGSTNAMVVFHYPSADDTRRNRYAWYISRGSEATSVTARQSPDDILEALSDGDLARLFRRSMPISSGIPQLVPAAGRSL